MTANREPILRVAPRPLRVRVQERPELALRVGVLDARHRFFSQLTVEDLMAAAGRGDRQEVGQRRRAASRRVA